MKRVSRDRRLTREEAAKYDAVRKNVEEDLPDLISRHRERMANRDKLKDCDAVAEATVRRMLLLLEDDPRRTKAMERAVEGHFSEVRVLATAASMIDALGDHIAATALISLDHDLPPVRDDKGALRDSGTGRDVADRLAMLTPTCPVVIHSSNTPAAIGMERVLKDCGWTTYRVSPFADLEWVATAWLSTVLRALQSPLGLDPG